MFTIKSYSHLNNRQLTLIDELCTPYEAYCEESSPNGERCFYTASGRTRLIGFFSFLWIPGETEAEVTAYVHPEFRNQGVFRALINAAQSEFVRLGINSLYTRNTHCAESDNNNSFHSTYPYSHSEYLLILDYSSALQNGCISDIARNPDIYYENLQLLFGSDGIPVSWCHLDTQDSFTNIWGVETSEKLRRKGYASLLLSSVIDEYFRNDDYRDKPLILQVSSRNTAACALYKKLGFKEYEKADYVKLDFPCEQR